MEFVCKHMNLQSLFVLIVALLIMPVTIAAEGESSRLGQVVIPNPATPANAKACVEPTDVMRRDHMKFLLHQRDETVINGIRTKKHSLTECVNCHAQAGKNGKIVRADEPDYFCTECHTYAAVKIDCFECHSDRAAQIASELEHPEFVTTGLSADSPARSRLRQTLLQQAEISVD